MPRIAYLLFFLCGFTSAQELIVSLDLPVGESTFPASSISPDGVCFTDDANFTLSYDGASSVFTANIPTAGNYYFTALPCAGASYSYAMVSINAGGDAPPVEPPVDPPIDPPQNDTSDRRVHFFGHSLIFEEAKNVPYWMNELAFLGNREFAANGQYGFLPTPPASDNLGWDGVPVAWSDDFSIVTDVVMTVFNFGLLHPPTSNGDGSISPAQAIINTVDWVKSQSPNANLWIYESWADGGYISQNDQMTVAELANYHNFNLTVNAQWYDELMIAVNAVHPDVNFMPVARTIANINTNISALLPSELYVDSAPHGTPNTYFLAALVTYMSMYDDFVERVEDNDLSGSLLGQYPDLIYYIKDQLNN